MDKHIIKPKGFIKFLYNGEEARISSRTKKYNEMEKDFHKITIYGDMFSGEEFAEMVECGGIMDYDGILGYVLINGYDTNLGLYCPPDFAQGEFAVDLKTWRDLCKKYDIKVEWCNK